jgi:hypothetical protein
MRQVLEQAGYIVLPARNGREALRMLQMTFPDLVITDRRLPHPHYGLASTYTPSFLRAGAGRIDIDKGRNGNESSANEWWALLATGSITLKGETGSSPKGWKCKWAALQ